MKKLLALALTVAMILSCLSFAAVAETTSEEPIKITLYYSDNATLPFQEDWLAVKAIEEEFNVDFTFEVIPIADYSTKVSLALNTGTNTPDVILYQNTAGENGSLALNGALVPISDYSDWTPNFNARVEEFGLTDKEIEMITLIADGLSNKEIASSSFLSEGTVRNYISTILEKLDLRDRTQLAIFYYKNK